MSRRSHPHWASRDAGDLDVIDVGTGTSTDLRPSVPFRVERTSGVRIDGLAELRKPQGDWRLVGLSTERRGFRVPSEGAPPIGSASATTWLIAIGISAALMLLVAFVIGLTP